MFSLNISPGKLFGYFRRLQLWPTDDWQLHHNNVPTHASHLICGKTSNHPGDSALLQPRFGTLWLLAFPKTKITFERKEISDLRWDSGKYSGAADRDWENCVRSQGAYFEEDWGVIVLCTMFLLSCIFFKKCLYFSFYMSRYPLDRPRIFPCSKTTWKQWHHYNNEHTWHQILISKCCSPIKGTRAPWRNVYSSETKSDELETSCGTRK